MGVGVGGGGGGATEVVLVGFGFGGGGGGKNPAAKSVSISTAADLQATVSRRRLIAPASIVELDRTVAPTQVEPSPLRAVLS